MISQRNSRFTNLVFMVLLVAPAFMASTPAQGMFSRAAVHGAGMRRALPRQMVYGFSVVDLIADNPWKSGLAAAGVIALITYLTVGKVRTPVDKGFNYVGNGFSWCWKQVKLQWAMRVANYSEQDIRKLHEKYAADVVAKQNANNTLVDANFAVMKARTALTKFENGEAYKELTSKEKVDKQVAQQEKQKEEADQKESKQEKEKQTVAATTQPQQVKLSDAELEARHSRLQNDLIDAIVSQHAAQKEYDKAKKPCDDYNDLIKYIAKGKNCDQEALSRAGDKYSDNGMALSKLLEKEKTGKLTDNEVAELENLRKKNPLLQADYEKKKAENQKIVGGRQTSEAAQNQKPNVSDKSNVPLPLCSSSSASSDIASNSSSAPIVTQSATSSMSANDSKKADSVSTPSSSNLSCSSSSVVNSTIAKN